MKTFFKYTLIAAVLSVTTGCDSEFETLNQNPVEATADRFNPKYLFSTAQYFTFKGDEAASLYYATTFTQQFASLSNVGIFDFHGDKYVYHQGNTELLWNTTFDGINGPVKLMEDIFQLTKGKEEYHNLIQMTRIWKTIVFSRLTDMYGNVPYSEAGKGYYEQIYKPKYDSQQEIYASLLSELEDATSKLDASKDMFGAADIAFKGDIAKWRKLGYSMMLRLGMRLSKVDPASAQAWVKKAHAGGVMGSNDDSLLIRGADAIGSNQNLINGFSQMFRIGYVPGKIGATFFNYLKTTEDPRLRYIAAVYPRWNDNSSKDTTPSKQKGLPNGLDRITLVNDPSYDATRPEQEHQYSGINRDIFAKLDGARFFLAYPETQLLLSEAAVRGWISESPEELYERGVKAGLQMLTAYDASAVISDEEVKDYLIRNPFVGTTSQEKALEQINTQYWIVTFLNGYETFANVRRSGYPKLIPVNYPDNETGGLFPGRLRYPQNEMVVNKEHYEAAVSQQGADNFITRVWWDK